MAPARGVGDASRAYDRAVRRWWVGCAPPEPRTTLLRPGRPPGATGGRARIGRQTRAQRSSGVGRTATMCGLGGAAGRRGVLVERLTCIGSAFGFSQARARDALKMAKSISRFRSPGRARVRGLGWAADPHQDRPGRCLGYLGRGLFGHMTSWVAGRFGGALAPTGSPGRGTHASVPGRCGGLSEPQAAPSMLERARSIPWVYGVAADLKWTGPGGVCPQRAAPSPVPRW